MEISTGSRAAYFTNEEQTIMLRKFEEYREIIQAKNNTIAGARRRKECWQKIADFVNACNSNGPKRTWLQIKNKYKNLLQSANRKKGELKKTGGGPPTQEHDDRLLMDGVEVGVSSDSGTSQQGALWKVDGDTLVLIPPPVHRLAHTEELEPMASTSRASDEVEAETVKSLQKRSLQLDIQKKKLDIEKAKLEIEYTKLAIKKIKLDIEKMEHEKKTWETQENRV